MARGCVELRFLHVRLGGSVVKAATKLAYRLWPGLGRRLRDWFLACFLDGAELAPGHTARRWLWSLRREREA